MASPVPSCAADRVAALAAALGIERYALALAAGSLSRIEALAAQWARGEISVAQVRDMLDQRHERRAKLK